MSTDDTGPQYHTEVREHARIDRLVQQGQGSVYCEQAAPVAEPSFPLVVGVPDRDRGFVGRDGELDRLRAAWDGAAAIPVVVAQATVGLGGVGKSALVAEHAHRLVNEGAVEVVRWFIADRRDSLEAAYVGLAPAVGVDVRALQWPEAVARVRGWLETTERPWLVVFDNAEDPVALDGLLPARGRGQVVVTSRRRDWAGRAADVLEVSVLPPEKAAALLYARAGWPPDAGADAEALVERLGWLALAVVQAGAYTAATGMGFAEYHALVDHQEEGMLARNDALVHRYDRNRTDMIVATVWQSSLDQARQECALAEDLLGVVAYLAPEDIPSWLFTDDSARDEPLVGAGERVAVLEAIAALERYSLVETHRNDQGSIESFSVHRLVSDVTRIRHTDSDQPARWCATAIRLIASAMPVDTDPMATYATDPDQWPLCARVSPHLLIATAQARDLSCELGTVWWLLDRYGAYTRESGSVQASINFLQEARDLAQEIHGVEHPNTLTSWHNLARSYRSAGRTGDAIRINEWVADRRAEHLGSWHPDTLTSWHNLAGSYWLERRTGDAIRINEWVVDRLEEQLGAEHPDTLMSWHNLAGSYWLAGRTDDAIPIIEWIAELRTERLGVDHPDTLSSWHNLANSYRTAGRTEDAIALGKWVADRRRQRLGANHPLTLTSWRNLAASCGDAGRTREAIALGEWVADRLEEQLGAEHPDTLRNWNYLADSYRAVGRIDDARRIELWLAERKG